MWEAQVCGPYFVPALESVNEQYSRKMLESNYCRSNPGNPLAR